MTMPLALRACFCLILAAGAWVLGPPPDSLRTALALFVLIGGLWVTEALPLAVTALLVPILAVAGGVLDVRAALAPFAHPIIFLFLGSFALAAALHQQGLDQALAHAVLRAAGGRRARAVVMLAALTAAISMWMSNTATAAMMLPLAVGLLGADASASTQSAEAGRREAVFVLLALAYSASIGGMATLVGSPPNAIAAAQAGIGFAQWLAWGLPVAALLWALMMGVLWLTLRPQLSGTVSVSTAPALEWTRQRVATLLVFGLTVLGWVAGGPLARALGLGGDVDTWVALSALVALVATGCLRWQDVESQTQWSVLLLFGGGLALSEVVQSSGASRFLAEQALNSLRGAPLVWVVAGVVVFVILLSELLSNTAAAALVLPIFVPAALTLGVPAPAAAFAVALAASCGFMLPVATPPNALVFATEQVPQAWMMRCGFWLNLTCAAVVTAVVWLLLPTP